MIRELIAIAALAGCGSHDAAPKRDDAKSALPRTKHTVDTLSMTVPDGWQRAYDAASDTLTFTIPASNAVVRIERAQSDAVAGPDAFLATRRPHFPTGTTATLEKRERVRDGFALTATIAHPSHSTRATYVVRELGSIWYQCTCDAVPDDGTHTDLVALCKSLRL